MPSEINEKQRKTYLQAVFGKDDPPREAIAAALDKAHEIRRFEVNLYWQRSLYFAGFIIAFLIGFTSLLTEVLTAKHDTVLMTKEGLAWTGLLCLALLGCFTSLAWYYVHEGARFWQTNWELHIDYLEDSITGRLHKSIFDTGEKGKWEKHYSLNKINRSFIVVIIIMWGFLTAFATVFFMHHFLQWIPRVFEVFEKTYIAVGAGVLLFVASPLFLAWLLNGCKCSLKLKWLCGYWRRHDHYKYGDYSELSWKDEKGRKTKLFLHPRKFPPRSELLLRNECNCNCKECCAETKKKQAKSETKKGKED